MSTWSHFHPYLQDPRTCFICKFYCRLCCIVLYCFVLHWLTHKDQQMKHDIHMLYCQCHVSLPWSGQWCNSFLTRLFRSLCHVCLVPECTSHDWPVQSLAHCGRVSHSSQTVLRSEQKTVTAPDSRQVQTRCWNIKTIKLTIKRNMVSQNVNKIRWHTYHGLTTTYSALP